MHTESNAVKISRVSINKTATYLFLDVSIDSTSPPGNYPLTIQTANGRVEIPFKIEPALDARTNFQGITTADVIYLIMIDRFADGDSQNNTPADAPPEATDRANPRAYHGGDLRGIINHLPI